MAHAFIDAIANAGADAVKFQTHIASAESTPSEPWRTKFSRQDATRYEYWKRMEFTPEQWAGLKQHADERGLLFLSSPFSMQAVELLIKVGVAAWKVASGEVGTGQMLDRMAATGLPLMLSTGMSTMREIDEAVARIGHYGLTLAVMQCSSRYPCPPEQVGLNLLAQFRERYGCAVGLSDHSATIFPGLAAAGLGADVLEVHVTLSRDMFGPDVCASLTTSELRQLVDGVRFIEQMLASPVDKDRFAEESQQMRSLFTKSVVAGADLPAGTVLKVEHLMLKKPGSGIPASQLAQVIGDRLVRDVKADQLIMASDLEGRK